MERITFGAKRPHIHEMDFALKVITTLCKTLIAWPVIVRRSGENLWSVCNQSSSITFEETSSYWSAPKSS